MEWSNMPLLVTLVKATSLKELTSKLFSKLEGVRKRFPTGQQSKMGGGHGKTYRRAMEWYCGLNRPAISLVSPEAHSAKHCPQGILYSEKVVRVWGTSRCILSQMWRGEGRFERFHMLWRGPKRYRYWKEVVHKIYLIFSTNVCLEPISCVLGYMEQSLGSGSPKIAVLRYLYQARKAITWKWLDPKPPSITDWQKLVNNTIMRERLAYCI